MVLVGLGVTRIISLDPILVNLADPLESELVANFDPQRAALFLVDGARPAELTTDMLRRLVKSVKRLTGNGAGRAIRVLLCPSPARDDSKRRLEPFLPRMTVLALAETPAEIRVRSIGVVG